MLRRHSFSFSSPHDDYATDADAATLRCRCRYADAAATMPAYARLLRYAAILIFRAISRGAIIFLRYCACRITLMLLAAYAYYLHQHYATIRH